MRRKIRDAFFCAGLPYTGDRTIDESERGALLNEAKREGIKFFLSVLTIPVFAVVPVVVMWRATGAEQPNVSWPVAILLFSMFLFGLPVSIFVARDLWVRVDILKETVSAGEVRCFKGEFNKDDWTSRTLSILSDSGFLNTDSTEPGRIELFMHHDVIYRINKARPAGWIAVELTSAALPPTPLAQFSLPRQWITDETSEHLERRRLSEEEIDEIRSYASRLRWGVVAGIILVAIWMSFIVLCVTTYIGLPVRQRINLSLVASAAACGLLIYRPLRRANRFLQDADAGWAIVHSPSDENHERSGEKEISIEIEFLPASNAAWRIAGKPAGWRRTHKRKT